MSDHVTCVRCGWRAVRGGDTPTPYACTDCTDTEPDLCAALTGRTIEARRVIDGAEYGLRAYLKLKCRCGTCREAKAQYRRELAARAEAKTNRGINGMTHAQLAQDLTGVLLRIGYHPRVPTVYVCQHCGALEKTGRDCMVCEERDWRCRDPWSCSSPCDETCHATYPTSSAA